MNIFDKYLEGITVSNENVMYQEKSELLYVIAEWVEKLRNLEFKDEKIINDKVFLTKIKKITGITLAIDTYDKTIARVHAPLFDMNHIFKQVQGGAINQRQQVLDHFKTSKESVVVDFKKAKISGRLTDVPSLLRLNPQLITKTNAISSLEVAGMIIHELGHIFINFAYLGTVYRDNYLVNDAILAMKGASVDKRKNIIANLSKDLDIKPIDPNTVIIDVNDEEQLPLQTVVLTETREKWINLTGYDFYSDRTCEQLADHFAIQHRAAKYLSSAIDKIEGLANNSYKRSKRTHVLVETAKAICLLNPLGLPIFALALCSSKGPEIYDKPIQRLQTMQQVLRSNLKDMHLDPSSTMAKEILNDIKFIDGLIDKAQDRMSFVDFMYHKLMPSGRKRLSNEQTQKAIESLTSSKLYEQALRFKQLGVSK